MLIKTLAVVAGAMLATSTFAQSATPVASASSFVPTANEPAPKLSVSAPDARPFSVRGLVGQDGERWVPVHGNLPLSAAAPCLEAVLAYLDEQADALGSARHPGELAAAVLG